jgi:hypothetical protein
VSKLWLAIWMLGVAACATAPPPPNVSADVSAACPKFGASTYHFPADTFDYRYDDFNREWYGGVLSAMGEPSLSCGEARADETYRFLWLRSRDNDIAIRIYRTGNTYSLRSVERTRSNLRGPLESRRFSRRISETEWNELKAAIERATFWTAPVQYIDENTVQIHGSQWIFEGRADHWHVIDRFMAGSRERYDLGLLFLRLARMRIPEDRIY